MNRWVVPVAVVAGGLGAVVLAAPRSQAADGPTIRQLVTRLRATGLEGRELVTAAIQATAQAYTHYSAWHLWESPSRSLRHRRGWSHQYNTVLARVLKDLGFGTRMVHTVWIQGGEHPWWHNGHTWVKVNVDGRWLDACASGSGNQVGELPVTPDSDELPYHVRTRWAVALSLAPFVVTEVWRAWLTGRPVPGWIYRRRDSGPGSVAG